VRKYDLDFLYPIDDASESCSASQIPGYQWPHRSFDLFGRFGVGAPASVLGADWAFEEVEGARVQALTWADDDPLASLFSVLYGVVPIGEALSRYAECIPRPAIQHLAYDSQVQFHNWVQSPIEFTGQHVQVDRIEIEPVLFVIDASNPDQLIEFWNLRAAGYDVFPLPQQSVGRFRHGFTGWLDHLISDGSLNSIRSDGSSSSELRLFVVNDDGCSSVSEAVMGDARAKGVTLVSVPLEAMEHPYVVRISTSHSESFSATISSSDSLLPLNLPRLGIAAKGGRPVSEGYIAAHVEFDEQRIADGVSSFAPPNLRRVMAKIGLNLWNYPNPLYRPDLAGPVISVSSKSDRLHVRRVSTSEVLDALFLGSGWSIGQSDNGKFTTTLMQLVGGPRTYFGNQPAIRDVLDFVSRSDAGKPIAALIDSARRSQQDWPVALVPDRPKSYPVGVIHSLLLDKILRPYLPLKCPNCSTEAALSPEHLTSEFQCDMCGRTVPLGYLLGSNYRNDWVYALAGNVPRARLAESMPILASMSIISALWGNESIYYKFGVTFSDRSWKCEVDLVAIIDVGNVPTMVVGEVKSYRDEINEKDVGNLRKIQNYVSSSGMDCFFLVAVLREALTNSEKKVMRASLVNARTVGTKRLNPLLPIVFASKELSSPPREDGSPVSWHSSFDSIASMAIETCKRNLGLLQVIPASGPPITWDLRWSSLDTVTD
jgi:hypothetical protein